jgi:hypothetical protein
MANYRVSTNANNCNKTTQDKTNNKNENKTMKNGSAKAYYTQTCQNPEVAVEWLAFWSGVLIP